MEPGRPFRTTLNPPDVTLKEQGWNQTPFAYGTQRRSSSRLMLVMKCSRLLRFGSRPSVKLLKVVIGISLLYCQTSGDSYFFSNGAGAGRSEFQMSVPHFHLPSACFSQTSTYLPRSLTGFPLASFIVSSYVPLKQARSPDLATSTLVAFQLITRPGLAIRSCQTFRIASFVVADEAFG